MTKEQIISKIKTLDLPDDSYVVFGSCPMAVFGLREANDIDLYVSSQVLQHLRNSDWMELYKAANDTPLVYDVFEAHDNWNFSSYKPTLDHLRKTCILVDGVPFAALDEVRKWKQASGGDKHLADVALIDKYLSDK